MPKICIVVPCYNEESRFPTMEFAEDFNSSDHYYCFVNDGSRDRTIDVLENFRKNREDRVLVVDCKVNKGKAEAVRSGILSAREWKDFYIVGYFDADLATPLCEADRMAEYFSDEIVFVFGSRVRRTGARIQRKWYRHILGRVFATMASMLLELPVYDTQCGAKLFRANIAGGIFNSEFSSKWIFDVEIFFRLLILMKFKDINLFAREIPLDSWVDKAGSKIRMSYFIKVLFDLNKIRKKYKRQKINSINVV